MRSPVRFHRSVPGVCTVMRSLRGRPCAEDSQSGLGHCLPVGRITCDHQQEAHYGMYVYVCGIV